MSRLGILLQVVQDGCAVVAVRLRGQHDAVRTVGLGEGQPGLAAQRDDPLEPLAANRVEHGASLVGVVEDREQDAVAGVDLAAIVAYVDQLGLRAMPVARAVRQLLLSVLRRRGRQRLELDVHPLAGRPPTVAGHVGGREEQRERGPGAGCALHADLTAEHECQLARDRQAQAGAAVAPAGGAVGLLERLEDELELVRRDPDTGVCHGEAEHLVGAAQRCEAAVEVRRRVLDGDRDAALLGELERVREQVAQDLLQPLLVGQQRLGQVGPEDHLERETLRLRDRAERALDVLAERSELDGRGIHRHLAGFDLRQVEDVGDQRQQVLARRVDVRGALHLLGVEVLLVVVGQQLRQDQQRVQWRPELVRHVGQELRLVAGGQRELLGLLLQAATGRLDLAVLDLDRAVLLRQPLVGALQLLLLCLQLAGLALELL